MAEQLLTARDVALRFGVSAETVLRWTRNGDLPAFRLPSGALRYDRRALLRWLDGCSTDPDAPTEGDVPEDEDDALDEDDG